MGDAKVVALSVRVGDDVVELPAPADGAMLKTAPRPSYCPHEQYELDSGARRVYCAQCGREVPVFDALLRFTMRYERYRSSLEATWREIENAQERLADLLREERNAKARKRRRER